MVDTTEALASLEKLFESTKNPALGEFIERVKAGTASISDLGAASTRMSAEVQAAIRPIIEGMQGATEAIHRTTASFGEFADIATKVSGVGEDLWKRLTAGINDYLDTQQNLGKGMDHLAIKTAMVVQPFLGIIPKSITGMGELGKAGYDAGQTISESFSAVAPLLSMGLGKELTEGLQEAANMASRTYELQRGLVGIAAAQGNLSKMMDDGKFSTEGMNEAMTDMSDLAYESAVATGQSVGSVMNLARALKTIPGALSEPIQVGGNWTSQLTLTSQVAAAFGKEQSEVAADLSKMYTEMELKGTKSFEVITKLYTAAGDSKLRSDAFTESVMGIAGSFKILGDNTEAATNVVKAFDTAFKDSEISPAAMQEVITGMTEGIKNMERGTQAFISAQTGGPGGLAGAFQIEYAMQTGNMEEVLERTMRAMQAQFGGEVLTLKDAAENPALAGEFYKQVQYLTQVAGVAKSDREAYRILEAMQSGVMDMLRPGAEGTERAEILSKVQERGMQEQERTTSAVVRVQQVLERWQLSSSQELSNINTQLVSLVGIDKKMAEMVETSATRGIRGMAGPRAETAIIGGTEEDYINDLREKMSKGTDFAVNMLGGMVPFGERAYGMLKKPGETGGGLRGLLAAAMPKKTEEELATTPVALPPGTRAGMGALPGGAPEIPLPAPAGPGGILRGAGAGAVNPMEYFMERGEFPPITVEHAPIEVNINLSEPFNQKVKAIAEGVYEQREGGRQRQRQGGNAATK